MSGIKIISEEVEKDVTMLSSVDPEFVSLVRHGANRMPFRVIKTQKGGEQMGSMFIQSILLTKGVGLADLTGLSDMGYLSEAKTDAKTEFDSYVRYKQADEKLFIPESFKMVKLNENVWALTGQLSDSAKSEDMIMLSEKDSKQVGELPTSPMDVVFGDQEAARSAAMVTSFKELMDRELSSMLDVVFGSLKQAAADPKKRKKSVLDAVDAFRNFLSVGLDVVGSAAAKTERPLLLGEGARGGTAMAEKVEVTEDFTKAVKEVVSAVLEEKEKAEEAARKAAEDEAKKNKVEEAKKVVAVAEKGEKEIKEAERWDSVTKSIEKLTTSVNDLSKKYDELGNQPTSEGSHGETDDPPVKKAEKNPDGTEKKKSVFAGLLTKTVS